MTQALKVTVVGTGYVGLGTAIMLASLGHEVIGLDVDQAKVAQLAGGELPIYEPGLDQLLLDSQARIRWTTDYEAAIPGADVIFICVGTPPNADGSPNLKYVAQAAQSIAQNLNGKTQVIVNKSTVPVGTGDWVARILEEHAREYHANRYLVVSNPEFLREGTALFDSLYPDRIVLGSDSAEGIERMKVLYAPLLDQSFTPPSYVPRPEGYTRPELVATALSSAEMIKYAANAFLALKISFANEIAGLCERVGADISEVTRGIGSDARIGPRFLSAGAGWGGSCFGKDTSALISTGQEYGYSMPILEAAIEVNARQRSLIISKLQGHLHRLKGKRVAVLGMAFKPNTDDLRDAPAHDTIQRLNELGATVVAHDPIAMPRARREWSHLRYHEAPSVGDALRGADAVIIATEWDEYRAQDWAAATAGMRQRVVIDTRNILTARPEGIILEQIGRRQLTAGPADPEAQFSDGVVVAGVSARELRGEAGPGGSGMRVLLTGSAGFVGSHLTERLLADGHSVIGVDNYLSGQPSNTGLFLKHPRFSFVQADASLGLPEVQEELDWVLHFASPASPPHYQQHQIETLMVGAQGTQNALELARRHGAAFMLASTSEVYGDPDVHPQPESYWGHVNPNGPRSCYDEAKRYAEAITFAYHRTHGLDTRVIRIFNTYGPRMRPDDGRVVTNLVHQALKGEALTVYGDGSQTRSFQYVSDLVEGVVRLMTVRTPGADLHSPVNLGNPDEYSILEFATVIRDLLGEQLQVEFRPLPQDDPMQRRPDISRAQALLGWAPGVPLREGLRRMIADLQPTATFAGQARGVSVSAGTD